MFKITDFGVEQSPVKRKDWARQRLQALIIDGAMLTRQHTPVSDLALGEAAVHLDVVGKFIFPDSLSGFQESQREMEKYSE